MSITTYAQRLAVIDALRPWRPGVPLGSTGVLGPGDRQHLLHHVRRPLFAPPPNVNDYQYSLINWLRPWRAYAPLESQMPFDQEDRQQLLWGPVAPLWQPPGPEPEGGFDYQIYRRRRR